MKKRRLSVPIKILLSIAFTIVLVLGAISYVILFLIWNTVAD